MPVFLLSIKADLENVASLKIDPGARFCLSIKDSTSDEVRDRIYVTRADEHELAGSKGTANYAMKWVKDAKHQAYINIMDVKGVTREYRDDDQPKFVPIIAFECRGLEPTAFHPEGDWTVTTSSGKVFEDVDLTEKEWCDFDEKANETVGVYEFESKFELHRGS